jgi:lipoate-protein ligase A
MAYDIDSARMLEILRIGREKLSDKGIASAAKRVDPLRRQTGLPREAIIARMIETFRDQNGLTGSAITPKEWAAAERLVETKFGTEAWLRAIP